VHLNFTAVPLQNKSGQRDESVLPSSEGFIPTTGAENMIVQAVLTLDDGCVSMLDRFGRPINDTKTDGLCVEVEAGEETINNNFAVLAEER